MSDATNGTTVQRVDAAAIRAILLGAVVAMGCLVWRLMA